MIIAQTDFNGAEEVISQIYPLMWGHLYAMLTQMPLHLKASDQQGIQGKPIFDVVGSNQYIKGDFLPRMNAREEVTFYCS
jgi:hypothetical protein